MKIDLVEGTFYCFGCGKTGDALKFVELVNPELNDLQALLLFTRILKSKKCKKIKLGVRKKVRKDNELQLEKAKDYYYGLGTVDWKRNNVYNYEEVSEARDYMQKRGFSPSTLNNCKAKVTYNKSYAIIFPMLDNGKFKGWVCRTMIKEIEKKRKYLYNEGFSRATTLVGNYGKKKFVYVVEGYMDMLKMRQNGCHNVVALLGWKATDEQINKLKNAGITDVISALDNDEYGREGTKYLKKFFNVHRFKYLKGIKDPGEMTKELFEKMNDRTIKGINLK